jgi:hypothetical protein
MITVNTQELIEKLVAECAPVRRLSPPFMRAAIWLGIVTTLATAAVWIMGDIPDMVCRLYVMRFALEMTGTLFTGAGAVVAAFYLSMPDRSRLWALLPVPPLLLWLSSAGVGCYLHWIDYGPEGWALGPSANCFVFIVGSSVPLAIALYWALKQAVPLDTLSVTAIGGLGVAALAATILQFFHPFDVTLIDLSVHVAAVLVVVILMSTLGRARLASAMERGT